jgi:hypothetical protein
MRLRLRQHQALLRRRALLRHKVLLRRNAPLRRKPLLRRKVREEIRVPLVRVENKT